MWRTTKTHLCIIDQPKIILMRTSGCCCSSEPMAVLVTIRRRLLVVVSVVDFHGNSSICSNSKAIGVVATRVPTGPRDLRYGTTIKGRACRVMEKELELRGPIAPVSKQGRCEACSRQTNRAKLCWCGTHKSTTHLSTLSNMTNLCCTWSPADSKSVKRRLKLDNVTLFHLRGNQRMTLSWLGWYE